MSTESVLPKLQEAKKIVICTPSISTSDSLYFVIALIKYLQDNGSSVDLILKETPSNEIKSKLDEHGIAVLKDVKPLNYVISIDYSKTGIEKVTYDADEENGQLKFYITPTDGVFDFDNIEYATEGSSYDLTITYGLKSYKDMGKIFESNPHIFNSDAKVLNFISEVESLGDDYVNIEESNGYANKLYQILGSSVKGDTLEVLIKGMLDEYRVVEGETNPEMWKLISDAAEQGVDINKLIRDKYYSKSYANLDVQIKLMHNVQVDKSSGVIWSVVSKDDLDFCGVTETTLDLKGRVIYNISKDFNLAIAVYEIAKSKLRVVVESNNSQKYSALKIAEIFNADADAGSPSQAQFIISDMALKDFETKFFTVLKELYSIDVRGSSVEFGGVTKEAVVIEPKQIK